MPAATAKRHDYDRRARGYHISLNGAENARLVSAAQDHGVAPHDFAETILRIVLRDDLIKAVIDGDGVAAVAAE